MKLKKFIKLIDMLNKVRIFTEDDEECPAWEGYIIDLPWVYLDMYIGRTDGCTDEPIYIYTDDEGHPVMVINLYEKK